MFPFNKTLVLAITAIVAISSIAIFVSQKEDPVLGMMAIFEEHTDKCVKELKTTNHVGDECAVMYEVGERIFEGNAITWGADLISRGLLNESNLPTTNRTLRKYGDTLRQINKHLNYSQPAEGIDFI